MVTSIFETSNSRTTGCLAWTVWIIVHVPGRHVAVERRLEHGVVQLVLGIRDGRLQGLDFGSLGFQVLRPRPFQADIEILLGLLDLCGRAVPPRKAHVEVRLADRPLAATTWHSAHVRRRPADSVASASRHGGLELLDLLRPGPALHRQEIRLRTSQVSLGTVQRGLEIPGIDRRDHVPLLHLAPHVDRQRDQRPRHPEREIHFILGFCPAGKLPTLNGLQISHLDGTNGPYRLLFGGRLPAPHEHHCRNHAGARQVRLDCSSVSLPSFLGLRRRLFEPHHQPLLGLAVGEMDQRRRRVLGQIDNARFP